MASGHVLLLFLVVGIAYWQYGGGLAQMPAFTADYFASKNLSFNYGLVFLGGGLGFFVPQLAGHIKDVTDSLDNAFYLSGAILLAAVMLCPLLQRPRLASET
ncbi:MAG: hypothetical protein U0840_20770 [Gemmataceae bacterium]